MNEAGKERAVGSFEEFQREEVMNGERKSRGEIKSSVCLCTQRYFKYMSSIVGKDNHKSIM